MSSKLEKQNITGHDERFELGFYIGPVLHLNADHPQAEFDPRKFGEAVLNDDTVVRSADGFTVVEKPQTKNL